MFPTNLTCSEKHSIWLFLALFVPDQGVWKLVKERHRRNYVRDKFIPRFAMNNGSTWELYRFTVKSDSVAFFTMEYRKPLLLGVEDLSLFDDDVDDDSHSNKRKTPPCSESKRTDKRSSYGHVSEYSSK